MAGASADAAALLRESAHWLASGVLLLAFLLLGASRMRAALRLYAAQAVLTAAVAACQAALQASPDLAVAAALLAAKGALIPMALHRFAGSLGGAARAGDGGRFGASARWAAGLGLAALAVLVSGAATVTAPVAPSDLGLALATALLGLLLMLTERGTRTQALGLLSLENGAMLAVIGAPGFPLVAPVTVASGLLAAGMVALFLARSAGGAGLDEGFSKAGLDQAAHVLARPAQAGQ